MVMEGTIDFDLPGRAEYVRLARRCECLSEMPPIVELRQEKEVVVAGVAQRSYRSAETPVGSLTLICRPASSAWFLR